VYTTATQAAQTVAAVRAGAQDLGQLATHGLPVGADALAQGVDLAEASSVLREGPSALLNKLPTPSSDELPLGL
jgi:hypothetical protein